MSYSSLPSPSTPTSAASSSSWWRVIVLIGSVYLLVATNTGLRNGFLIALRCLTGWMFSHGRHLVDLRHRPEGQGPVVDP